MHKFVYRELEFEFDPAKVLVSEAIWLERSTGFSIAQVEASWVNAGAIGIMSWLMIALRRNGRSDLAKWERLQSINLGSTAELHLELNIDVAADEEDEQEPDPTTGAPSPSSGETPPTPDQVEEPTPAPSQDS